MVHKDIKLLKIVAVVAAFALTVGAASLLAQGQPPARQGRGAGQGFGPGPGMGFGPGQGMGPGGRMGRGFGPGAGPGGLGLGPGMMLGGLHALNLTDAQKASIQAIHQNHEAEFKAIADAAIAARKVLGDAVTADTVDEAAIRAASAAVAKTEADGAVLRAKVHSEVWSVLTPEQQAQAKQMRDRMTNRIGMRFNQLRQRVGRLINRAIHSLL